MVRLIGFFLRLRPHGAEILVALCCLWAGKCYLVSPSNFTAYSGAYALADDLLTEARLGVLHCAAGCLTLVGLALAGRPRKLVRGAGGLLAAFGWGVVGASFLLDNPDLTVGGLGLALCAASVAALLVLPAETG